jgi:predicted ATPase with chaperone activity
MEIAAGGLLLHWALVAGKTMLAKRLPSILPPTGENFRNKNS